MSDESIKPMEELKSIVPESPKPQENPVEMIGQSIDKMQAGCRRRRCLQSWGRRSCKK